MGGGGDPMGGGGGGLDALLGGGPEMGGGMPGGEPMGGGMPGGDPTGGGGGMPGLEGIGPEQLQMLLAAIQEAQTTPEAVEAGAVGKAASLLRQKQASGEIGKHTEWRPKTAAQAQRYQAVLNYIKEVSKVN